VLWRLCLGWASYRTALFRGQRCVGESWLPVAYYSLGCVSHWRYIQGLIGECRASEGNLREAEEIWVLHSLVTNKKAERDNRLPHFYRWGTTFQEFRFLLKGEGDHEAQD